jgi:RNA-dependent RNA polymerase
VLDGIKTGVSVKNDVRLRDSRKYEKGTLEWKVTEKKRLERSRSGPSSNIAPPKRGEGLPPFIMDLLKQEIKEEYDRQCAIIEKRLGDDTGGAVMIDEDLKRPWEEFLERVREAESPVSTILQDVKKAIEKHVQETFDMWKTHTAGGGGRDFTSLHITQRQDRLRSTSRFFATIPDADKAIFRLHGQAEILRYKASYAYIYCSRQRKFRFAFDVAYRQLCAIKAQAVSGGTEKTVTNGFYMRMNLHKAFLDD